ncbi:MAG: FtsX-like permease family protein, partial [Phototrophicaceae bacterium]
IPAWTAASKSLQQLKSSIARAPKAPLWARYYLDVIILMAGFAFLMRLLSLSSDEPLVSLLRNPSLLLDALTQGSASTLFSDVFNLAGPVLILLGASMLWLRIFPLFIRVMGNLFANGDGLTIRLAFWNVERDPAHYAQLVLLLIGTLALGTSSLALSETRAVGGWSAAQAEVGADAVLNLDPAHFDASFDWDSLPTVIDAIPMIRLSTQINDVGALIALNPATAISDELQAITAPFEMLGISDFRLPGLLLPDHTNQLQLDVYAREPQDAGIIDTQLTLILEDQLGIRHSLPLNSDQSTEFGEFFTYQAIVPDFGVTPYRITRLELYSEHNTVNEFEHVVYLDNLVAITEDGQSTVINRFEPDTLNLWQWNSSVRREQVLESTAFSSNTDNVTEGENSLRVLHLIRDGSRDNTVNPAIASYNDLPLPPIPIVVSQSFANTEGQASRFRRPLQIGDTLSVGLNLPTTGSATSREDFSYEIVGVVPNDYPSFVNDERLIFADYDIVRYRLNTYSFTSQFPSLIYDYNAVFFALEGRTPDPSFIDELQAVDGYLSADYAWDRFSQIQRDPLTNAVTGILFAGFWVSLFLSLLDFGFYMAVTIRRRALAFATLQAIGWNERNLLNLLLVEQVAFITPAIIIGIIFGMLLANLILPFLSLIGSLALQIPILAITILIVALIVAFALILRLTAIILRRLSLNQVMRFGE